MSTSILYHAFGLKGIHYESTDYIGDCIVINARMTCIFRMISATDSD